jgi:hypothetical protein
MRPWSDQVGDEAFACLDLLNRLVELGIECGLDDRDSENYVRAVQRLGEILPAPHNLK